MEILPYLLFSHKLKNLQLEKQNIIIEKVLKGAEIIKDIYRKSSEKWEFSSFLTNDLTSSDILLRGGRHALFILRFQLLENTNFIVKPYSLRLFDILYHFLSFSVFNNRYCNFYFPIKSRKIMISAMETITLGKYEINGLYYPFVIQKYSQGINLIHKSRGENLIPFSILKIICKNINKDNFIIDPSPQNWYQINLSSNLIMLEYTDLLFLNNSNIKQKSEKLKERFILLEKQNI